MIFYHFTQAKNKDAITQGGIKVGEFPFQEKVPLKLVSLTSRLCAEKHGLFSGQTVLEGSLAFEKLSSIFPLLVSGSAPYREMKMHDQTEVAIQVEVSETDGNLLSVWEFAKLASVHLNKAHPRLLIAAALATADFPCNDASDQKLDSRTKEYLDSNRLEKEVQTRGWYFYKGNVTASMVKGVFHRKDDGSYPR
jgi:hypothetical protein